MSGNSSSIALGDLSGLEPLASDFPLSTLSMFMGQLVVLLLTEVGAAGKVLSPSIKGCSLPRLAKVHALGWHSSQVRCQSRSLKQCPSQKAAVIRDPYGAGSQRPVLGTGLVLLSLGLTQRVFRKALPWPRFWTQHSLSW